MIFKTLAMIIKAKIAGRGLEFLKCDRKGCAWIEFHERLTSEHVGKPCRLCGASLMSQQEYSDFVIQRATTMEQKPNG